MTIDIHTHLGKDRMSITSIDRSDLPFLTDQLIAAMDQHGVDVAVVTPSEPYVDSEVCIEAAEMSPDRLLWSCSMIPRPIDRARTQLRSFVDRGCAGLVMDQETFHPSDPAADALAFSASMHGLPIFLHTYELTPEGASFIDRISAACPELQIVVAHMGGILGVYRLMPYLGRGNIWLDISSTLARLVEPPMRMFLDVLAETHGFSKLVFGSEHHNEYGNVRGSLNLMKLDIETLRLVTDENPRRILRLN
ncbi:MAG: amidohydrolase family protein [Candidatus Thorarchaeota archaeon]